MGGKTKIEWTDATWNPILGCSRVSEGCRNCYAERLAARFQTGPYEGLTRIINGRAVWTGQINETKKLLEPLKWKEPRRVFVNSMSDLFHENVTDEQRDRIFAVMALCPQHTFQVLTKRPERMLRYIRQCERPLGRQSEIRAALDELAPQTNLEQVELLEARIRISGSNGPVVRNWQPLPNVLLGVSVENQAAADERVPLLLQTPAAKRFVSCEPLLGPVTLRRIGEEPEGYEDALCGLVVCDGRGTRDSERLDWVICGGESGPGARPMHPEWARSLRDQCQAAGVPFFFKQWGEWLGPMQDGAITDRDGLVLNCSDEPVRVGKRAAGAVLDGRTWKEFPR